VQTAQLPHDKHMGGKNLKSVNQYKYLGAVLSTELPECIQLVAKEQTYIKSV